MLADDDFGRLIEQLKPQMLRTAWRLLGHLQDAEDALQDALLTVHCRWGRVARHPNPAALVLRICAQAAVDRLRRQRRVRDCKSLVPAGGPAVESHDMELIVEERRNAVRLALLRLSSHQRIAVIMRYFQDQNHAEIAAAIGCREATARKHLQRAIGRLATLLGPVAVDWNIVAQPMQPSGAASPQAGE